jgi:DNA-binding NarL/FixJ family response regulator
VENGGTTVRRARTNVLIVDDHQLFAEALALAIDTQADMKCSGRATDVETALATVRKHCPDVVLLDILLPGMDGIAAIAELRMIRADVRIIVLTADGSPDALARAADAGADGFVAKEQPFHDLLEAVRSTESLPIDSRALARITPAPGNPGPGGRPVELTCREYDILVLLADGLPVSSIAEQVGISVHTCRAHVRAVLAKMAVHSQLAAVVAAAKAGLLPNLRG